MNGQQGSPQNRLISFVKPCLACGQEMSYVMPPSRIFNAIDVSSIVFVHNRPDRCPKCGTMFLPIVSGFGEDGGIVFEWKSVSAQKPPIIVGGDDATLKQAIDNAIMAEKLKNN